MKIFLKDVLMTSLYSNRQLGVLLRGYTTSAVHRIATMQNKQEGTAATRTSGKLENTEKMSSMNVFQMYDRFVRARKE